MHQESTILGTCQSHAPCHQLCPELGEGVVQEVLPHLWTHAARVSTQYHAVRDMARGTSSAVQVLCVTRRRLQMVATST
eukprot:4646322-Prymnesium_polylepis.1